MRCIASNDAVGVDDRPSAYQRTRDAICVYLGSDCFRFAVQMAVGTVPLVALVLARCDRARRSTVRYAVTASVL